MATARRILVVEDDDDIRDILQEVLSAEGYEVHVARDGLEALVQLQRGEHASLILLDMMMPKMDGETFLSSLKRDPRLAGVRVIVISGNARARDRARELAAEACLVKPFEIDDLLGAVQRLV